MSKQHPSAPIASTIGPCPTVIQIVGRPGTGSFSSTIALPDHPQDVRTASNKITWTGGGASTSLRSTNPRPSCFKVLQNQKLSLTCMTRNFYLINCKTIGDVGIGGL